MAAFNTLAELEAYFDQMQAAGLLSAATRATLRAQWLRDPDSILDESYLLVGGTYGDRKVVPPGEGDGIKKEKSWLDWLGEAQPGATFLRQYGLAEPGQGAYRNWLKGFAAPLSTAYAMQSTMQEGPLKEAGFASSLPQVEGNLAGLPSAAYQATLAALKNLFGAGPEERKRVGMEDVLGGEELGELARLFRTGLRQRGGQPFADWFAGNLPEEQQRWLARQTPEAGLARNGGSFLDYLMQKYNLRRYF